MASIGLDRVSLYFHGQAVLDEVSVEVEEGEFFVLVGPSGSGKSSMLRVIAGLAEPTSGDVRFNDKTVTSLDARQRNVAMVFQSYALYPHKNVFENIAFGLRAKKVPNETVDKRVRDIAGMLGIEPLLARWPKELSGGERQRVAIGRAIVREPEVYLLDEPLSNLDAGLRMDMRNEIANIHRRLKTTFVYVTHDQVEAMTLGERIAIIRSGRIEQVDTPDRLYHCPTNRFVAGFFGSPPMNFLHGTYRRGLGSEEAAVRFPQGSLALPEDAARKVALRDGEDVVVGVRPEALTVGRRDLCSTQAELLRVEPMGHEGLVYLKAYETVVVARVDNVSKYRNARHLPLYVDTDQIYLFAETTGECIWTKGLSSENRHRG